MFYIQSFFKYQLQFLINLIHFFINQEELKSTQQIKRNCSEGINYLLLKLYSIVGLTTSSVMRVSTKKGQRKGLNEEKRAVIEGNLKFHINIS